MNTQHDPLADAATDFFWLSLLFWALAGVVLIVGGVLWYALQGLVFCLLVLWHGSVALCRYVAGLVRRAAT